MERVALSQPDAAMELNATATLQAFLRSFPVDVPIEQRVAVATDTLCSNQHNYGALCNLLLDWLHPSVYSTKQSSVTLNTVTKVVKKPKVQESSDKPAMDTESDEEDEIPKVQPNSDKAMTLEEERQNLDRFQATKALMEHGLQQLFQDEFTIERAEKVLHLPVEPLWIRTLLLDNNTNTSITSNKTILEPTPISVASSNGWAAVFNSLLTVHPQSMLLSAYVKPLLSSRRSTTAALPHAIVSLSVASSFQRYHEALMRSLYQLLTGSTTFYEHHIAELHTLCVQNEASYLYAQYVLDVLQNTTRLVKETLLPSDTITWPSTFSFDSLVTDASQHISPTSDSMALVMAAVSCLCVKISASISTAAGHQHGQPQIGWRCDALLACALPHPIALTTVTAALRSGRFIPSDIARLYRCYQPHLMEQSTAGSVSLPPIALLRRPAVFSVLYQSLMAHVASLAQTAYLTSMASSERTENETVGVASMELTDSCTMQMIYLVALAVCRNEERSKVGNKRKLDLISSSNTISPNIPTTTVVDTVDALIVTLKTCASMELIITNCAGGGGGGMSSGSIQNISTVDLEKVERALRLPIVSQVLQSWLKRLLSSDRLQFGARLPPWHYGQRLLHWVHQLLCHHPLHRPTLLEWVCDAVQKFQSENSFTDQQLSDGRQQLLRLLVASVHVGDWCSVFNLVTARLDRQQWKGAAGRGLVAELSESMRPPFSTRFADAFGNFLQLPRLVSIFATCPARELVELRRPIESLINALKTSASSTPTTSATILSSCNTEQCRMLIQNLQRLLPTVTAGSNIGRGSSAITTSSVGKLKPIK